MRARPVRGLPGPPGPRVSERELAELTRLVREFSTERDWQQFHDPKSVILALVGEVGELAELFQWVPADEAVAAVRRTRPARRASPRRWPTSSSTWCAWRTCSASTSGEAARAKLAASHRRFAADEVRGVAPHKP